MGQPRPVQSLMLSPARRAPRAPDGTRRPAALVLLMLLALAHGLIYALGVPPWQAPDEPMLFEYAALMAELQRVPTPPDRSPALEARILASMLRAEFFRHTLGATPQPPPRTLDEARSIFPMPRQVGGDPPLYFALAAVALRLTPGWSVEAQLYLLRSLNALLLPAVVACTYLAGRAIGCAQRAEAGAPTLFPLAAASLVALQPMAAYSGAALGNDSLTTTLGALLCLLLVRLAGHGFAGRGLAAFTALALLALAVKRTALPFVLLAAVAGTIWLARALLRGGHGAARRRAATFAAVAITALWLAAQFAWGAAARWYDARTLVPAARVAAAGGYALSLEPGSEAVQVLPEAAALHLRNNVLRVGARIWSAGPATGRLVIYTPDRRREQAFSVSGAAAPELSAPIPSYAAGVRIGVVAESGQLYVGEVWARGVGLPGNLIANGAMERPAVRPDSPLRPLLHYLRAEDVLWAAQSGRLGWSLPADDWLGWLFVSFWGHFGWFNVALVAGSPWAWALGAICAAGLLGAALSLWPEPTQRRLQIAALLVLVGVALVPLLINALIDMLPVQQGRYLFPVLPAAALLIALGHERLVPVRRRTLWLLAWLSFWLAFAAAALARLAGYYYG